MIPATASPMMPSKPFLSLRLFERHAPQAFLPHPSRITPPPAFPL